MLKTQSIKKIFQKEPLKKVRLYLPAGVLFLLTFFLIYNLIFFKKIYPSIYINEVLVSGNVQKKAHRHLSAKIKEPEKLILHSNSREFEIDLATYEFSYNFEQSVKAAYNLGRNGRFFSDLLTRLSLPFNKITLPLDAEINEEKLQEHLSIIADEITTEPVYPAAKLVNGQVLIEKGSPGNSIDFQKLNNDILMALSQNPSPRIEIPVVTIDPSINDSQAQLMEERASKLIGKSIKLTLDYQEFILNDEKLLSYLNPEGGYFETPGVLEEITSFFNREPQNSVFVFLSADQAGGESRVAEFEPAKDGVKIDENKLYRLVTEKIALFETTDETYAEIEVPAKVAPPEVTTEEVNNLGIKELIGRGNSTYYGSISSRIHNIGLASSHFNGVLVAPGDTFSFNDVLGDVSSYTGYKQAYIIKDGRTVLGDGGGVCQVSTTLFRAILDAGLPIVERRAHSYRVSYYEQGSPPGLDATVYAPTTDLKFKNDTPGHILIQTIFNADDSSLVFEIYGTNDGRQVKLTRPVVYGTTPPPDDLYQDDPTLPSGTIKQIDYKAWGAKVVFSYEVEKDGEVLYQKDFVSNYRPWQAVFLRGVGPQN